jgi:hypothetical protein
MDGMKNATDSDRANEKSAAGEEDLIAEARKEYERARDAWADNQERAKEDLNFARLGDQWPEAIRRERERDNRPCLTFNKMPAFIRQVVNDARQNKPSVKVHPQDSDADVRVAQIYDGLIRNIETTSDADVAYDTAIEHAVGQGFGFWRYDTRYTDDDSFEQDIVIERIANPFTVYGDPRSTAADSSDWNVAFIVTSIGKDEFERDYPEAERTDWDFDFKDCPDWLDGEDVVVAEYWTREKASREVVALSDGSVVETDALEKNPGDFAGLSVVGKPRTVESHKVIQRLMTGAEVLKTVEWAGKYIPIVPVYGDEVIDERGRRHFRSLIREARSAQQMFNYWRTTTTELVALAPKAPWVGEERSFELDPNWDSANSVTHSKLVVPNGAPIPQRQPFAGVPAGALQEALNASDDMKSIIGLYDASLGARSNETSGVAINARQREGDVSTFHFIDNLTRAIRHGGRILLDLIPKVYSTARMVRVLGDDLTPRNVQIAPMGQAVTPVPGVPVGVAPVPGGLPQPMMPGGAMPVPPPIAGHIYDITAGKYDLTVSSGPSYSTRRQEASDLMMQMMQASPQIIPLIADIWVEQQDMPLSDKLAERLKLMLPPQAQGQGLPAVPPQMQAMIQQGAQQIQQQGAQLQAQYQQMEEQRLKIALLSTELANKAGANQAKQQELQIKGFDAQTRRIEAVRPEVVRMGPQVG